MNIPTHEAANRLQIHPINLLLAIHEMVGSISECWPMLDDGYVQTIQAMNHPSYHAELSISEQSNPNVLPSKDELLPMEMDEVKVLDKLQRRNFWGGHRINWDGLSNICHGVSDFDKAVKGLFEKDFLTGGRQGPFSLNPAKTGEINQILNNFRSTPS